MSYRVCAKCDTIVDNTTYLHDKCAMVGCDGNWKCPIEDGRDWEKLYDERNRWRPLRWLKDGKRRIDLIIETKIRHIHKYMNKINLNDKYMIKHLENKLDRLKIYQHKSKQIKGIMSNEKHYTYRELKKLTHQILYIEKNGSGYRL